jgi:hypothetical protein
VSKAPLRWRPTRSRVELNLSGRSGRRWYHNGPPQWLQGRKKQPCQSADQALKARRKAIKHLKKHGSGSSAAKRVRQALKSCDPDSRCLSGACPECMRAFQRWFVHAADEFLRSHPASRAGGFKAVSLVPSLVQMEQDDE